MEWCRQLGLAKNVFTSNHVKVPHLTNGAVLEILDFGKCHHFDNNTITTAIATITGHELDINITATITKYLRVLRNDKSKRGPVREAYRAEIFFIPTLPLSANNNTKEKKLTQTYQILSEQKR